MEKPSQSSQSLPRPQNSVNKTSVMTLKWHIVVWDVYPQRHMTKLDRRLKSSPHCGSPIEPSWWYGHPRVPVPISTALLILIQTMRPISARGPAGPCYLSVRLCFALGKRTAESPGGRTNSIRGSREHDFSGNMFPIQRWHLSEPAVIGKTWDGNAGCNNASVSFTVRHTRASSENTLFPGALLFVLHLGRKTNFQAINTNCLRCHMQDPTKSPFTRRPQRVDGDFLVLHTIYNSVNLASVTVLWIRPCFIYITFLQIFLSLLGIKITLKQLH